MKIKMLPLTIYSVNRQQQSVPQSARQSVRDDEDDQDLMYSAWRNPHSEQSSEMCALPDILQVLEKKLTGRDLVSVDQREVLVRALTMYKDPASLTLQGPSECPSMTSLY